MIKSSIRSFYNFIFNSAFRSKKVFSLYVHISTKIGYKSKIMRNVILDKECSVGNYTYIGEYTSITKTTIGNFCSIASNVRIGHGEHNLETFSTNSLFFKKSYLTQKSCVIKNDVWIGTEAVISRGVTIGNGAVIGANSFVNKDIPDYAIVVGSPAKILRYRFDTTTRKKLLATEWWNFKDLEEIKTIFKSINNDEI